MVWFCFVLFFPKRTVSFNDVKNCFYLDVQVNAIPYLESENKHYVKKQ